jgi:hypothetical protein
MLGQFMRKLVGMSIGRLAPGSQILLAMNLGLYGSALTEGYGEKRTKVPARRRVEKKEPDSDSNGSRPADMNIIPNKDCSNVFLLSQVCSALLCAVLRPNFIAE